MPCLCCVIDCGLKLFSPLPAPIVTCVVLGRDSIYLEFPDAHYFYKSLNHNDYCIFL